MFRRDRNTRGGGVLICAKNTLLGWNYGRKSIFEVIAVEVRGKFAKFTWAIIGIYRAPNEDM
jgi:hypothetical protein